MKFWLETCEVLAFVPRAKFVEASFPNQAAKMFAEMGARGRSVIQDEDGKRTEWMLHATVLHYVYPILEHA